MAEVREPTLTDRMTSLENSDEVVGVAETAERRSVHELSNQAIVEVI